MACSENSPILIANLIQQPVVRTPDSVSDSDRRRDMRVRVVSGQFEILEPERKQIRDVRIDLHLRQRTRRAVYMPPFRRKARNESN